MLRHMENETKLKRLATVAGTAPSASAIDDDTEDASGTEAIQFRCPGPLLALIDAQVSADAELGYPRSRSAVIRRLLGQALKG